MDESEFAALTAQEFGNLAAVGMIISELDEAGISVSDCRTQSDIKRAVRSRAFRRHLRNKKKVALKRLKEIDQKLSEHAPSIENLNQERLDNEKLIRECDANIHSKEQSVKEKEQKIKELESQIEWARNERPEQLAENLQKARENLEKFNPSSTE